MAHAHTLIVRLAPDSVLRGIARGIDLGDDRIGIDASPCSQPWLGDLHAVRHLGTWIHGRRRTPVTVDVVPLNERSAQLTVAADGRGIREFDVVDLAERLRSTLETGAPGRLPERAEAPAPAPVPAPIVVVAP